MLSRIFIASMVISLLLKWVLSFSNRVIGELFGLSNSSASKRAGIVRKRLRENKRFKNEFDRITALMKL